MYSMISKTSQNLSKAVVACDVPHNTFSGKPSLCKGFPETTKKPTRKLSEVLLDQWSNSAV
jgi:hypothetical protein